VQTRDEQYRIPVKTKTYRITGVLVAFLIFGLIFIFRTTWENWLRENFSSWRYPGLVLGDSSLWKIGARSAGGKPIYFCEISSGKQVILVIGSIHGDERVTSDIVAKLADSCSHWKRESLENTLVFIPIANPDGYKLRLRTNANKVDINRNFPTKDWIPTSKADRYFPGPRPASEPETEFIMSLISQYSPRLIISVHMPLNMINYDGPAEDVANGMSLLNGYTVRKSIGYETPGSLGTYAGAERNIPVITLEVPDAPFEVVWQQNRQALFWALTDRGVPRGAESLSDPTSSNKPPQK
jgi:murein peptide amidase A